jgi:hypothetical protein
MRLVSHRTDDFYFARWDGSAGQFQPWVESSYGQTPILCLTVDGYVHPDFSKSSSGKNGPTIDPYSPKEDNALGCDNALAT